MRSPEDTPTDPDKLIRFGAVASVDLGAARMVVELDEGVETPPLRWLELRAGRTRTWSPPVKGEQVVLLCPGGEIGLGLALRGLACSAFPPLNGDELELVEFDDGARLSYDLAAHVLAITLVGGGKLAITGDVAMTGAVAITGDMQVSGDIRAEGDVTASGISLKNHRHSGVAAGSAVSGGPQ